MHLQDLLEEARSTLDRQLWRSRVFGQDAPPENGGHTVFEPEETGFELRGPSSDGRWWGGRMGEGGADSPPLSPVVSWLPQGYRSTRSPRQLLTLSAVERPRHILNSHLAIYKTVTSPHVRRSRLYSGLGFHKKIRNTFYVVPFSLGSGLGCFGV